MYNIITVEKSDRPHLKIPPYATSRRKSKYNQKVSQLQLYVIFGEMSTGKNLFFYRRRTQKYTKEVHNGRKYEAFCCGDEEAAYD